MPGGEARFATSKGRVAVKVNGERGADLEITSQESQRFLPMREGYVELVPSEVRISNRGPDNVSISDN